MLQKLSKPLAAMGCGGVQSVCKSFGRDAMLFTVLYPLIQKTPAQAVCIRIPANLVYILKCLTL